MMLVLLAENENIFKKMSEIYCNLNHLVVNIDMFKLVQFRTQAVTHTSFEFTNSEVR